MPKYPHTICLDGRLVPASDATRTIVLHRTAADIAAGKRGNVAECADAQCGIRQRKKFPHAFHGIVVYATRAYVIDKVAPDGEPAHLIRYGRPRADRKDVENFDKHGPTAIAPRQIVLEAIKPRERLGRLPKRKLREKPRKSVAKKRRVLLRHVARRGVARRLLRANGAVIGR